MAASQRPIIVTCSNCGSELRRFYPRNPEVYGSAKVKCPYCQQEVLDQYILELAIRPKEWYETHRLSMPLAMLLMLAPFGVIVVWIKALISLGAYDRYRFLIVLSSIAVFAVALIPCFRYISSHTTVKTDARFYEEYDKSAARLADPAYRRFLADANYFEKKGVKEFEV